MKTSFEYRPDDYAANRPGYPSELYDFIVRHCALERSSLIIDAGAGTGKGSVPLLNRSFRTIAIDAAKSMLQRAEHRERLVACVEALPLDRAQADLVLCPQSFHWFESVDALREFHRILKPSGHLVLVWNVTDLQVPHQQEYEQLIKRFNPEYKCAYRDRDWSVTLEKDGIFETLWCAEFPHTQAMTVEDWAGLARTKSYVRSISKESLPEFQKELSRLMESHSDIDIRYTAKSWLAVPVPGPERNR